MENKVIFSCDEVKKIRKEAGYTQKDLAKLLGISVKSLWRYENLESDDWTSEKYVHYRQWLSKQGYDPENVFVQEDFCATSFL